MRIGLVRRLDRAAKLLLRLSFLFDAFGSDNSGFHMELAGKGFDGKNKTIRFELIANSGDGPYIPCIPAILLTKKIASGEDLDKGAYPCVGIIDKKEYLDALSCFDVCWTEENR